MSDNFIQENSDIITLRAMANVFMPEALDPVGQEDDDVDNDGDSDKSDEYLKKRRKAVGSAIDKRKKKLKEAASAAAHTSDDDDEEITEKKVKNKVVINPEMKESKDYDPMEDDDFDHDEAEENRGVSGKNNPKGGKRLYKKREVKKEEYVDEVNKSDYLGGKLPSDEKMAYGFKDNKKRRKDLKTLKRLVRHYDGMKKGDPMYNSFEPEGEQLDENPLQWLKDRVTKKNNQSSNPTPSLKRGAGALGSYANRSNAAGGDAFANAVDRMQNNSYEPEGEMTEEASDRAKDEHLMRGGMAARKDYDRPPAKKKTNKELGIRDFTDEEREKRKKEMSAHLKKMRK